jgi:hypothetical protein
LLAGNRVIQSHEVESAMNLVDRQHYSQNNPYMDAPQGIGYGATISAPHMVIFNSSNYSFIEINCLMLFSMLRFLKR